MLTCAITLISGMLKYHAVIFHHWIFQSGLIDVCDFTVSDKSIR